MGIVQRHATEDYVAESIQTVLNDVNETLNNTVSVVSQELTDEQKQQAMKNIGVDTAIQQAISGFYSYGTKFAITVGDDGVLTTTEIIE